jgi:hypothetical protein
MTIDKKKLLQWIESKKYVYEPPYDTVLIMTKCKAALKVLSMLEQDIELGEFKQEERE